MAFGLASLSPHTNVYRNGTVFGRHYKSLCPSDGSRLHFVPSRERTTSSGASPRPTEELGSNTIGPTDPSLDLLLKPGDGSSKEQAGQENYSEGQATPRAESGYEEVGSGVDVHDRALQLFLPNTVLHFYLWKGVRNGALISMLYYEQVAGWLASPAVQTAHVFRRRGSKTASPLLFPSDLE